MNVLTAEALQSPSRIAEKLYLGSLYTASKLIEANPLGINMILDVSGETGYRVPENVEYYCIPFADGADVQLTTLKQCHDVLQDAQANGKVILVHCAMGISRSTSVVAMLLINTWIEKTFIATFDQAIDHIRKTRFFVQPARAVAISVKKYLKLWPYDGSME